MYVYNILYYIIYRIGILYYIHIYYIIYLIYLSYIASANLMDKFYNVFAGDDNSIRHCYNSSSASNRFF